MIVDLQNHLIKALEDKVTREEMLVFPFPDNVNTYSPKHVTTDVLVNYVGSKYTKKNSGVTDRDLIVEFRIVNRGYTGRNGALAALEKVISAMWFHQPVVGEITMSRLLIDADGFVSTSEGIWQYYVRFKTEVIFWGQISENK